MSRVTQCRWCGIDITEGHPEADYDAKGTDGSYHCEDRVEGCPACEDGEAHPHESLTGTSDASWPA